MSDKTIEGMIEDKRKGNTCEDAPKIKKMVEDSSEPVTVITAEDEPKGECEFGCPHCEKIIKLRIQPTDKENIKL